MDRLGLRVDISAGPREMRGEFQYPLMDRLGLRGKYSRSPLEPSRRVSVSSDGSTWFEGASCQRQSAEYTQFQYPLMDRLGLRGPRALACSLPGRVSVSSDGSTWFEGNCNAHSSSLLSVFQYPLMDRLGLRELRPSNVTHAGKFQYPLMDRLGLREKCLVSIEPVPSCFSIL